MYILYIIILYITGGALVPLLPCLTFINLYDETSVNGKGLVKHLKDRTIYMLTKNCTKINGKKI